MIYLLTDNNLEVEIDISETDINKINKKIEEIDNNSNNKESISVPEFERITGMILELIYTLKQEFHKEVNIEKKQKLEEWRIETK